MRQRIALFCVALIVVLMVALSGAASAGLVEEALKVALWSAIATDRRQTEQWIDHTAANPLTLTWERPSAPGSDPYVFRCACLYEKNPILAGQPEKLHPYFDWWAAAVEAVPLAEWSPAAKLGAALVAANWIRIVINNNRSPQSMYAHLAEAGMRYTGPAIRQFAVIEYRIRF